MINRNDYRSPGKIIRAHGKEGSLILSVDGPDPFARGGVSFVFIDLKGSFVPFLSSKPYRQPKEESLPDSRMLKAPKQPPNWGDVIIMSTKAIFRQTVDWR